MLNVKLLHLEGSRVWKGFLTSHVRELCSYLIAAMSTSRFNEAAMEGKTEMCVVDRHAVGCSIYREVLKT